jgi:molybdate transport system substrate-binding protein
MSAVSNVCKSVMFLTMLVCFTRPASAQKKQIRVAAASDLQTVMPSIAKAFEEQSQIAVDLTYGSSGNFFAQIQNGAPFDVFFSADSEFPAKLMQANLAEPRSAVVYALGSLVLWMPANAKCDPQAEGWNCLLESAVAKIAIANPAHAPYGRAAVAALQAAQVYDQVHAKFVLGENISQAAQFVQSGNAQAGILASSQMRSAALQNGKQWKIPRASYPPIEQTVVILKAGKEKSAAEDFVRFATQGPGRSVLEQFGFEPPPAPVLPTERHK